MPGKTVTTKISHPGSGPGKPYRISRTAGLRVALLSATALAGIVSAPPAWAKIICWTFPGDRAETQNGGNLSCDKIYVGDSATGSLTILNGGTVSNNEGRIGNDAAAFGTVTVTGAGSTWTNNGDLFVGYSGTGELTVSAGGSVSSSHGYVGYESGSEGTVVITGSGSEWTVANNAYIGQRGGSNGKVTVSDGGRFETDVAVLGNETTAKGTVVVTGSGSTWKVNAALAVGERGTGVLTVSDGGKVEGNLVYLGLTTASASYVSSGTVSVSGTGSVLSANSLTVGDSGAGALILTNGGVLQVGGGSGTLSVASRGGSTGTLVFGAAAGEKAATPGWLSADKVQFGSGTGKVVFNHTDDEFEFYRTISGTGGIDVHAGKTGLENNHDYTGATTIYGGALFVNGTIASASTVKNGGILGGTGSLGAVTVESGGIFAPGDPVRRGKSSSAQKIDTVSVNGDFTLNAGGILEIEVSDPGETRRIRSDPADKVRVTGSVALSGATLRVVGLTGDFDDDQYVHVIIDNDGTDAVVGTFNTIDNRLAFYRASVSYTGDDGNDVVLTLDRNSTTFEDVAATPNEKAVAGRLDGLPGADGAAIRTAIQGLSTEKARNAYMQLSGDIYATNQVLNVQTSQQARQQVVGRLGALRAMNAGAARQGFTRSAGQVAGFAEAGPDASDAAAALGFAKVWEALKPAAGSGLWAQAVGGKGRIDGDGNAAAVDYDWRGVMSGYDTVISENARLGVFLGYVDGENRQTEVSTRIDSQTVMAGIYGSYDRGDWHLSGQAGWSRVGSDSRRELTFGGVDRVALSDYTDHVVSVDGELARDFEIRRNLWVQPYVALSAQCEFLDGFTEKGGGTASLTRASDRIITGNSTVGGRVSGLWDSGEGWQLAPQAGIGWRHHLGPTDNSVTFNYEGGTPFSVSGTETDHDTLIANVGISRLSDEGWAAYADYRPSVSRTRREHAVVAGLRFEW